MPVEYHDIAVTIDDQIITGRDVYLKEMKTNTLSVNPNVFRINEDINQGIVTITLEFVCKTMNFAQEIFDGKHLKGIRRKKVDDCTIQELLFAVRAKLKNSSDKK